MRWLIVLGVLALLAVGCGGVATPKPVVEQFSRDVVRVEVPYTPKTRQGEQAKTAADEVAQRFCRVHGRKAAFASFFDERARLLGGGTFYFVYRCVE